MKSWGAKHHSTEKPNKDNHIFNWTPFCAHVQCANRGVKSYHQPNDYLCMQIGKSNVENANKSGCCLRTWARSGEKKKKDSMRYLFTCSNREVSTGIVCCYWLFLTQQDAWLCGAVCIVSLGTGPTWHSLTQPWLIMPFLPLASLALALCPLIAHRRNTYIHKLDTSTFLALLA